ncbi:hypothetical protein B0A48_03972 [Cryoendolithus antarcticus]|uniref:Uncharacterized protein n=1 Tax=Cryoendolithus antarcticus TaxID=1507870 RepID=A0A1V8THB9_9PEZI|nr:hypothetical protein B0A48_03972 [Cryoendolithus antarcticus]
MDLDLISALQSLSVQDTTTARPPKQPFMSTLPASNEISAPRRQPHHELLFSYPCDIPLPRGCTRRLDAPLGWPYLSHQPTPSVPSQILPQQFFCLLAGKRQTFPTDALAGDALKLHTDVEVLAAFAGRTKLNIISVQQADGEVAFHVQSETVVYGSEVHDAEQTTTYTMDPRSFNHMMTSGTEWGRVLENLVRRKSKLARHIVRNAAGPVADEWMRGVEPQVPRLASQILVMKCEDVTFEDEENNTAMLECGHISLIPKRCLRGDSELETAELECGNCHQFVLRGPEREEARVALKAGKTAANLEVPTAVAPASQEPFKTNETGNAVGTIEAWIDKVQSGVVRASIRELRAHLLKVVEDDLRASVFPSGMVLVPKPAGWSEFLNLLMSRTMKFLQYRICEKCGGFGKETTGVHIHHGGDMVYTAEQDKTQMELGDIEEGKVGMKMR